MYQFPKCRKCDDGDLVPFSDFGSQGAPIRLQSLGLHESGLRLQHQDSQRRALHRRAHQRRPDAPEPHSLSRTLRPLAEAPGLCDRLHELWSNSREQGLRAPAAPHLRRYERRRRGPAEHPRNQRRPGAELGPQLLALAGDVRPRLLRHGDDRHGHAALRHRPLRRRDLPRLAAPGRPDDRRRHRDLEDGAGRPPRLPPDAGAEVGRSPWAAAPPWAGRSPTATARCPAST